MPGTSVFIDLVGRDKASPAFMKAAASAEKSSTRMSSAFKGAIGMAAKLGVAFGAYELVKKAIDIGKEAAEFQRDMTMIQTQAGASAAEVKSFTAALLDMSGEVAAKPEELAVSLYHVYSVGLRAKQALQAVRIAAEGARVGNADLEETTNALTASVASGIKGVQNMGEAMGALNAIVGAGDMKLSDLNEALGSGLLMQARIFNVTLTQVGAALATFGDHNIRGAYAATLLRMSIQDLAKPAVHADETLSKVGITADRLAKDLQTGGLTAALGDLKQHMDRAGVTAGKVGPFIINAFTKRAGTGLAILIQDFERYRTKLVAVATGAKMFGENWAATKKTTSFVFARIGDELTALGIKAANKLLPPITQFAAQIGVALPKAVKTAQDILRPFATFVGDVLGGAWDVVASAVSLVGEALKPVVGLLQSIKTPLGAIATAAIAAYAGFKLFSAVPGLLETAYLKILMAQDAMVGFGAKVKTTAASFVTSSTTIGATATVTGEEVAAAGAVARVGWASMLGPIGAIAIGVGALVMMFHRSSGASKEAAAAAKAYTDALKGGGERSTILDTIRQQLIDNNVPAEIDALNKSLGSTPYAGDQFTTAIMKGSTSIGVLRDRLQATITQQQKLMAEGGRTPAAYAKANETWRIASKLLSDLNTQYSGLSKAAAQDLQNQRAFGAASNIDQVTSSMGGLNTITHVSSDTAKQYANMMGIVVNEQDNAQVSAGKLKTAVSFVRDAYSGATTTAQQFLGAVDTFSKSAGTAADRATLIGETLKAANGDALAFQSQINASAGAVDQFATDVKSAAAAVGKHGESTAAYLSGLINLKNGTIDYHKAAAGPLLTDLQGIQSAAMAAAEATFQHARATMNGKDAADAAYRVYKTQTSGQLVDELAKLTGNRKEAQKLADTYFGMPKNVKTAIEQEGANPVVQVLQHIGRLLAKLTNTPWNIKVKRTVETEAVAPFTDLAAPQAGGHPAVVVAGHRRHHHHRVMGGPVTVGMPYVVGERRPELFVPDANGRVMPTVPAGTKIVVEKQELHVHYPLEGGLGEALPQLARMSAQKLGDML